MDACEVVINDLFFSALGFFLGTYFYKLCISTPGKECCRNDQPD